MKKVILISEENHGTIGVATSMRAAFQFLIHRGWLSFTDDFYLLDEWTPISKIFEDNGWEQTEESLLEWAMMPTLDWDGMFYFSETTLHEEE